MEPIQLRTGKAFHRLVARFYEFESHFRSEQVLVKATGRNGRADLVLWAEKDHSYVVVIETKNTYWDTLASRSTAKRNLDRHRRQLWSYIDGSVPIDVGTNDPLDLQSVDRQIGVVYPRTPVTPGLKEQIVKELGDSGISVVWFDEPPSDDTPAWQAWLAMQAGAFDEP
jgi:hypothetical protein